MEGRCNGEAATSAGYFAPTSSTGSARASKHIQHIFPTVLSLASQLISFILAVAALFAKTNIGFDLGKLVFEFINKARY